MVPLAPSQPPAPAGVGLRGAGYARNVPDVSGLDCGRSGDESPEAWQRCGSRAGAEPALPKAPIQRLQTAPRNGIPWWQQPRGSCRCLTALRCRVCGFVGFLFECGRAGVENWGVYPKIIKRFHRERRSLVEPRVGLALTPISVGQRGNCSCWVCRASGITAGSRGMLRFTPLHPLSAPSLGRSQGVCGFPSRMGAGNGNSRSCARSAASHGHEEPKRAPHLQGLISCRSCLAPPGGFVAFRWDLTVIETIPWPPRLQPEGGAVQMFCPRLFGIIPAPTPPELQLELDKGEIPAVAVSGRWCRCCECSGDVGQG